MPEVLFAKSDYGFAVLEADDRRMVIRFVDAKGIELYRAEIR